MNFSSSQLIWFIFSGDKPSERSTATDVPCCKLAKLTTTRGSCESDPLLVFLCFCFIAIVETFAGESPAGHHCCHRGRGGGPAPPGLDCHCLLLLLHHHHYHYQLKHNMIWNQVELGVSCQLDKQGGEPDDRGLMILPLTVSDNHIIFKFHDA